MMRDPESHIKWDWIFLDAIELLKKNSQPNNLKWNKIRQKMDIKIFKDAHNMSGKKLIVYYFLLK